MTTIVTRAGKGTPLTNAELDANFSNLNDFKVEQTSATGAAQLPSGSTAQRPGTPAAGYIRYNATTGKFEGYGSAWGNIGGGAFIGDTAPANPGSGDLWWNSATGHTFVYYGSAWVDLFGGAEGQYLPLTGGTISGNVGVGATLNTWASSRKVLQVGGSASLVANSSGSGFVFLGNNWFLDASSANAYINTAAASRFDLVSDGSFRWNIAPSGTAGNAISFTQAMTLDASGNLGLGVTPSAWGSGFKAIDIGTVTGVIDQSGVTAVLAQNAYYNSGWKYKATTGVRVSRYDQYDGAHYWHIGPSGTAGSAISFTQAMTLNTNSQLMISATNPPKSGLNTKALAGNAGMGGITFGGTAAADTGIPVNASGGANTLILLGSCNFGAGTQTKSAVYILSFYYDGNNTPAVTYLGGSANFLTFGQSASNTLTVANSSSGNAAVSWFSCAG